MAKCPKVAWAARCVTNTFPVPGVAHAADGF